MGRRIGVIAGSGEFPYCVCEEAQNLGFSCVVAGIKGVDDDGDGSVDEGNAKDDDEDGSFEEDPLNPIVYLFDSNAGTLSEWIPHTSETKTLSNRVTLFQAVQEAPQRILITLTLTNDEGQSITFEEHVCPRNVFQKTGHRLSPE